MVSTAERIPEKILATQTALEGNHLFFLNTQIQPWFDYRKLQFAEKKSPLEKIFFRHAKPIWTWSYEGVVFPQQLFEIPYRWFNGIPVFEARHVDVAVWRLCEGCP